MICILDDETISPSNKVICSSADETINPSGEALKLFDGNYIKPLDKTYD